MSADEIDEATDRELEIFVDENLVDCEECFARHPKSEMRRMIAGPEWDDYVYICDDCYWLDA